MEGRDGRREGSVVGCWVEKSSGLWRNSVCVSVRACGEGQVKFHFQGHSGPPTVVIRSNAGYFLFSISAQTTNRHGSLLQPGSVNKVRLSGGNKSEAGAERTARQGGNEDDKEDVSTALLHFRVFD